MRAADLGIRIGSLPSGPLDKISDVSGVTVGHCTIDGGNYHTGVTVVMPSRDCAYFDRLPAACFVQNGFGKTCGLMQLEELGSLETPVALTSTLNVGLVHDAMVGYLASCCKERGQRLFTVNPIVCECNDAENSLASDRPVKSEHVLAAIAAARADFDEGCVGAGTGTICHRLKGGIGSASRIVDVGGGRFTLGALVQTNQGELGDLTVCGHNVGPEIYARQHASPAPDVGSVIVVLATDAPLSDRQIKRVLKRASVGIIRVGSHLGHASGDVYVGFSTANRMPDDSGPVRDGRSQLREDCLNGFFYAAAEAVEEAVLNSMSAAHPLTGYSGTTFHALSEYADIIKHALDRDR